MSCALACWSARRKAAGVSTQATIRSAPLAAICPAPASASFRASSRTSPIVRTTVVFAMPSFRASDGGGLEIAPAHFPATEDPRQSCTASRPTVNDRWSPATLISLISLKGTRLRRCPRKISSPVSSSALTSVISPAQSHVQIASRPIESTSKELSPGRQPLYETERPPSGAALSLQTLQCSPQQILSPYSLVPSPYSLPLYHRPHARLK